MESCNEIFVPGHRGSLRPSSGGTPAAQVRVKRHCDRSIRPREPRLPWLPGAARVRAKAGAADRGTVVSVREGRIAADAAVAELASAAAAGSAEGQGEALARARQEQQEAGRSEGARRQPTGPAAARPGLPPRGRALRRLRRSADGHGPASAAPPGDRSARDSARRHRVRAPRARLYALRGRPPAQFARTACPPARSTAVRTRSAPI